jgi:hypothetical protein
MPSGRGEEAMGTIITLWLLLVLIVAGIAGQS